MAKYKNVVIKGPIGKADFPKEMSIYIEGALQQTGKEARVLMRDETAPYDFTKTLTESVTWRTAKNYGKIKNNEHLIDAPPMNTLYVGSAAPHAWWREYGASRHMTSDRSAEFMENIRAWFIAKIGPDPRAASTPKSFKRYFWSIVYNIRHGADAASGRQGRQPFTPPVQLAIGGIFAQAAQDGLTKMWNTLVRRYK